MRQRYRHFLDLILVRFKPGQVEVAFQAVPILVKDHRFRPKHIDRHVWETKGRFIAPQ